MSIGHTSGSSSCAGNAHDDEANDEETDDEVEEDEEEEDDEEEDEVVEKDVDEEEDEQQARAPALAAQAELIHSTGTPSAGNAASLSCER